MTGFELHHTILVVMQILGISLIGVLFFLAYQRRQARHHDFAKQFVDKLSSEDFVTLLESSAGRRSVERVLGSYRPAHEVITESIRRAVVLAFAGAGGLGVYAAAEFDGRPFLLVFGGLALATALGMLVAAALTRGRLHREDESGL